MTNFNGHLHVHTMYSALDGLAQIEELVLRAKELGHSFIAITDHGSSAGFYDAMKIRDKHNFNIILGQEFYFETETELKTGHLILLAKNQEGIKNIFKLQKLAYDNVYYKPRINLDMLREHNEGLICTTACIANKAAQLILKKEKHCAINHLKELQQIFKEDFYVELQSSTMEEIIKVNKEYVNICNDYNFKPIITNDVHYVYEEDYEIHDVLLCIQQRKKVMDEKRWRFQSNDYWLKSQEEMLKDLDYLTDDFVEKALVNIKKISEDCEITNIESGNFLPKFAKTKEEEDAILTTITMQQYENRVMKRQEDNQEFFDDVLKELNVIKEEGYSGYFLIVQEYISWAKKNNIFVGDGRGSGAGSKVAYTIGITEINPQEHNLLFERFLSKDRTPDFDTDFSDIEAVFKHLQDVYGKDNVAKVGALNQFTAKSATRKVMSVYGFSQTRINQIVDLMPQILNFTLEDAIIYSKDLKKWFQENKEVYKAVKKIEGIIDHFSTHAGGVIICAGPDYTLTEKLPTLTVSDDREKLIVELDKYALEELGHFKFDILGLKSLTLIKNATQTLQKIEWHEIDLDDQEIYDMLCQGDVLGIFQLSEQEKAVREQQPRNFEDLIAINALIRPGVGDWQEYLFKRRNKSFCKNELTPYMNSTNGIIVYQEQYLLLAQTYAGWPIAFSDKHIRKNKNILKDTELYEKWLEDCFTHGVTETEEKAKQIWKDICEAVSSGYGFNRSHSASYARLTFQTAYLKKYHFKEFYSAYMTLNINDNAKLIEAINEAKAKQITILAPDINLSTNEFTSEEEGVRYPLVCINGVGDNAWDNIKDLRPIKDLKDLIDRRTPRCVKKNTLENLIKAGAFDYLNKPRHELLEELILYTENTEVKIEPVKKHVYEKESLGLYLTTSPFGKYNIKSFKTIDSGQNFATILEVAAIKEIKDKHGNKMAFATGTNHLDTIKMVLFASIWKQDLIKEGDIILIKGKKDGDNILVNHIELIEGDIDDPNN